MYLLLINTTQDYGINVLIFFVIYIMKLWKRVKLIVKRKLVASVVKPVYYHTVTIDISCGRSLTWSAVFVRKNTNRRRTKIHRIRAYHPYYRRSQYRSHHSHSSIVQPPPLKYHVLYVNVRITFTCSYFLCYLFYKI